MADDKPAKVPTAAELWAASKREAVKAAGEVAGRQPRSEMTAHIREPQVMVLDNPSHVQHRTGACRSRAVVVGFDENSINSVKCADCGSPQRCKSILDSGNVHGAYAQLLTPDGYRCYACAHEDGWLDFKRDGFFTPTLGGEFAAPFEGAG